jgi:hypothetical protein
VYVGGEVIAVALNITAAIAPCPPSYANTDPALLFAALSAIVVNDVAVITSDESSNR